ncbi:mechanosensitive ion channel domain-containing protein [Arabidopsis lyrata subsp. lyrata]|uniref:Mechanosensitive ion channel protein n=1 Tax=Arabidopsis lyrata subsp. lyrata TaxID=81972 RepID=D7L8Q3_ARALL|nr:mechanosensitive ion channel domain-containing protein [Arabidopsis lyrata subsp. lyrata]
MDFRNSFKSHSSYKQIRSPGDQSEPSPEHLPILHDHDHHPDHSSMVIDDPKPESTRSSLDDGRNAPVERDASYKFWQDNTGTPTDDTAVRTSDKDPIATIRKGDRLSGSFDFAQGKLPVEDSPTKMVAGEPMNRQWRGRNNEEITLDVDQENDDVSHQTMPTPTSTARTSFDASRELRVSFNVRRAGGTFVAGSVPSSSSHSTTSSSATMRTNQEQPQQQEDEVVRCTSNMSFQRKSELISRVKTRSRLQDPPREEETPYSGWRSGQLKSGLLGDIDEEDDPLAEEDVPDEYKRGKLDAITLLQWLSLIAIIAALACSLSIQSWKKVRVWNLHLWKWEVFLLVLICGRLVSGWGIRIVVFFIERNFLLRKRVLYFVYGVRRAVQNCLWLGLVLLAWHFLFDKKVQRETRSRMNHKNISAWNMKRLMKIVRNVSLTTLDEQMLESTYEDESTRQIRSEKEAKAAARKIFKNVEQRGAKYIYLEDLMRFLREDEAMKTMGLFEGAPETKRISKSALKNWLVNAFRERRALALTLNDTKTAVNKLHHMINIVTAIVIVVIWLVLLEIASSKVLLFVSSQVVLLAFIFGNTVKTVFESIIFLFIVHPYDVGDRCEIDSVQLVVEEMNILTTVFLRYDNLKIMYPNSLLWQKSINNYYRSPDMGDAIEFCVHITTPLEKIAVIKQRISNYIDNKPEYWYPQAKIIVKDLEDLHIVRLAIWPCHRINHQDMAERWTRRAVLVEEVIKILLELDIQHRFYPLDINVRTMPTVVSSRVPPGWSQNQPA